MAEFLSSGLNRSATKSEWPPTHAPLGWKILARAADAICCDTQWDKDAKFQAVMENFRLRKEVAPNLDCRSGQLLEGA